MKYIVTCIALLIGFLGFSYAQNSYIPTTEDAQTVSALNTVLDDLIQDDKKELRHWYNQIDTLYEVYSGDGRLGYLLGEIDGYLRESLDTMKKPAIIESIAAKEAFVAAYASWIIQEHTIPDRCWEMYELLDDLSFVHDIPTVITLWTWYAETTCGFYLPIHPDFGSNWPFQIISKNYGTGDMTMPLFKQTLEDFLIFARHKYNLYGWAKWNRENGYAVDVSYTWFDLTGVVRHGALYNGVASDHPMGNIYGEIRPKKDWYVYNNYKEERSGAVRHGFLPMVINAAAWELENWIPKFIWTGSID